MEVREGMSKVVLTLGPGHTLREAARMMTGKGVGAAIVIDEDAPAPGIISERDLLVSIGRGEDPDAERVGDHMSGSVITAAPDWSLERAAADMAEDEGADHPQRPTLEEADQDQGDPGRHDHRRPGVAGNVDELGRLGGLDLAGPVHPPQPMKRTAA